MSDFLTALREAWRTFRNTRQAQEEAGRERYRATAGDQLADSLLQLSGLAAAGYDRDFFGRTASGTDKDYQARSDDEEVQRKERPEFTAYAVAEALEEAERLLKGLISSTGAEELSPVLLQLHGLQDHFERLWQETDREIRGAVEALDHALENWPRDSEGRPLPPPGGEDLGESRS